MMTTMDPVKWRLDSPVEITGRTSTATVGIATIIEVSLGPAGQYTGQGLGSYEITTSRRTSCSMDPATCTFTSTQEEEGSRIIS
jgi:hypothetical protein